MIANFHVHYNTSPNEQVAIALRTKNGTKNTTQTLLCRSYDTSNWHLALQVNENETIEYKYILVSKNATMSEHGDFRKFTFPKGQAQCFLEDAWRANNDLSSTFLSAAFKEVIFKREKSDNAPPSVTAQIDATSGKNNIIFQLHAAAISQQYQFCVFGNHPTLNAWAKPLLMTDTDFPTWQAMITVDEQTVHFEYKFAIYDTVNHRVIAWEEGDNRVLSFHFSAENSNTLVKTEENFRYGSNRWRGAGIAIPVFSLRSERGLGIGEFTDLELLVDWAVKTGLKLVQVLPVNDTVATKTWTDSYPYAAISVFALHPLYINIQRVGTLKDKTAAAQLAEDIKTLNQLETVDFEAVLAKKMHYLQLLFEQEKNAFFENASVKNFIEDNADWLKPYAAFCHLRDRYQTTNFGTWATYSTFSASVIDALCTPQYADFEAVAFYYFVQYHAHQQLQGATQYARKHHVILKGDLPIGIYRYSCDAWVAPELYNMNGQAGAPPDAYAVAGQNWGFPTYDWATMAKDNFAWWRKRMTKLSEYFDALRIDHILGFFRIWEIPTSQIEGTLGLFNPRLPYSRQELANYGLKGNLDRFTKPYITGNVIYQMFGEEAHFVYTHFLSDNNGVLSLKEYVDTQVKIRDTFASNVFFANKKQLEKGLIRLVGEVLLIEEPNSNGEAFNPRITVHTTNSYQALSDAEKHIINNLYDEYFYRRHDEYWKQQALWKLPALLHATNMLICGEDLGMIPSCVPSVMHQLNIIALEIQRMPKGASEFGNPKQYDYMTVCSPSCHDMSTIRGWWENNIGTAQSFYQKMLGQYDAAPRACNVNVVAAINYQHLESPSMWAIFPIQDLVGMDADLRRADANAEQINEPSNPKHYWRFRFHQNLEQLLENEAFNQKLFGMVKQCGR